MPRVWGKQPGSALLAVVLLCGAWGHARAQNAEPDPRVAAFGEKLARALSERDAALLEQLIDLRAIGRRAAVALYESEQRREEFAAGAARSAFVATTLASLDQVGGSVRMMKVVQRDGEPRPLLRWDLGDGGYEYTEHVLEPGGPHAFRVVDWWALTKGQMLSVSLGAAARLMMDPNPGLLQRMLGLEQVDRALVSRVREIGALEREGRFREAVEAIRALPDAVRHTRPILVKEVGLASMSGDDDLYRESLRELARRFGDEPSVGFMLLDHYFFEENWPGALASIDAIESRVGADGVTALFRANVHYARRDYERSVAHARSAIAREPELEDAYFSLVAACSAQGRYDEAVATLDLLRSRFGYAFTREDFADDPTMAGLAQSAAFEAWLPQAPASPAP